MAEHHDNISFFYVNKHDVQPLGKSWSFQSASHRVSPVEPGLFVGRSPAGPPENKKNYVKSVPVQTKFMYQHFQS